MRRWILLGVLVIVGTVGAWTLLKRYREEVWLRSFTEASDAMSRRGYPNAERILSDILPKTEKWWPHDRRLADTLKLLGTTYLFEEKYDQAGVSFRRAFPVYESILPSNSAEVGKMKTEVAMIYRDRGRTSEAEQYYSESLAIF